MAQQVENVETENGTESIMFLEARPYRPFKTSEEYLEAMKEDLAEWLNALYDWNINLHNFFNKLENGEHLCFHANNVRKSAEAYKARHTGRKKFKYEVPAYEVVYRPGAKEGTFFARDNVHNFIQWCRKMGIMECLLFETEDLVMRKNEKSFILCLLEVARRGARYGMLAPMLVQFEREIDRDIAKDQRESGEVPEEDNEAEDEDEDEESEEELVYQGPMPQIVTNDLKSLDEMVRDLVEQCSCPSQFPMIRVAEGKYRIGDTKTLIYVRILRNHVMVRVGGGWDTLQSYLRKHDPCRCKAGHRRAFNSQLVIQGAGTANVQMNVSYQRSDSPIRVRRNSAGGPVGVPHRKLSLPTTQSPCILPPIERKRSKSPAHARESSLTRASPKASRIQSSPTAFPRCSSYAQNYVSPYAINSENVSASRAKSPTNGSDGVGSCDTSSDVSDEGYKSGSKLTGTGVRLRKYLPRKLAQFSENGDVDQTVDNPERPDSTLTHASSECSSTLSADEIHPPRGETPDTPESTPSTWINDNTVSTNGNPVNRETPEPQATPTKKSKIPFFGGLLPKGRSKIVGSTDALSSDRPPSSRKADVPARRKSIDSTTQRHNMLNVLSSRENISAYGRSRSASNEGGFGGLRKDSLARTSYRNMVSCRSPSSSARTNGTVSKGNSPGKNTWSGRHKERSPINTDTFQQADTTRRSRATSASPQPPRRSLPSSPRHQSKKSSLPNSPHKSADVSPILQQVLKEPDLSDDHRILQKMEEIIKQYKGQFSYSLDGDEQQADFNNASTMESTDSSKIPVKITPRKHATPGPTKIPVPNFYSRKETSL